MVKIILIEYVGTLEAEGAASPGSSELLLPRARRASAEEAGGSRKRPFSGAGERRWAVPGNSVS